MEQWISVRNWRKFQHYDPAKRQPPWIKNYTELTDDDAYGSLTLRQRGLLHGIWLAYARSRCGLRVARVGLMIGDDSVRLRDIESLNHAGFIDIVASRTLANGYHDASAHARPRAGEEGEEEIEGQEQGQRQEQEQQQNPKETLVVDATRENLNGSESAAAAEPVAPTDTEVEHAVQQVPGHDAGTFRQVLPLARQLTATDFREVLLKHADRVYAGRGTVRNQPGLLVQLLQAAVETRRRQAAEAYAASFAEQTIADEVEAQARMYALSIPWEAAADLLKMKLRKHPDEDHDALLEAAREAYDEARTAADRPAKAEA